MSESLDEIIKEYYARQAEYTSQSKEAYPDNAAAALEESFRVRFLDWANKQPARPAIPHPSNLRDNRGVDNSLNEFNNQPIHLGFLADDMEYICSSFLEDQLRDIEMRDHEVNEEAGENKQLADLLEWKQEFNDFVEPTIPLPDRNSERHDVLEKMRHRVPVSPQKLPSSVMYTLLNSESTVSDVSIVHDGEKMAVGYSDSVLRVFDLTSAISDEAPTRKRRFEDASVDANHSAELSGRGYDDFGSKGNDSLCKTGPFRCAVYEGHTKSITSTSFYEDHEIFLSSSLDGTIRMWSESLQANISVFKSHILFCSLTRESMFRGHLYPVLDVEFSPVGYYFLSGSMDQTARLWSTETMEPIRICAGHGGSVDLVKWHPGCSYFGVTTSDGQFRLWDVAAPKHVRIFKQGTSAEGSRVMTCFRFGTDGFTLACGFDDGKLEVMDLRKSTELLVQLEAHKGPIWSLDCSRGNGNLIATGGNDSCIKLWSQQEKKCFKTFKTRSCKILNTFWTLSNLLISTGVAVKDSN